jgi:redox-sensitive bicupin YhaK (pirin superfamily)
VSAGAGGRRRVARDGALQRRGTLVRDGQAAWFDGLTSRDATTSVLRVATTDTEGAWVVLYAAPPTGDPHVFHEPFVGGTRRDLMRLSRDYMEGRFARMSEIGRARA